MWRWNQTVIRFPGMNLLDKQLYHIQMEKADLTKLTEIVDASRRPAQIKRDHKKPQLQLLYSKMLREWMGTIASYTSFGP